MLDIVLLNDVLRKIPCPGPCVRAIVIRYATVIHINKIYPTRLPSCCTSHTEATYIHMIRFDLDCMVIWIISSNPAICGTVFGFYCQALVHFYILKIPPISHNNYISSLRIIYSQLNFSIAVRARKSSLLTPTPHANLHPRKHQVAQMPRIFQTKDILHPFIPATAFVPSVMQKLGIRIWDSMV